MNRAHWDSQLKFSDILPDIEDWLPRGVALAAEARDRFGLPQVLATGQDPRQHIRWWDGAGGGTLVFIHGGYWRAGEAEASDYAVNLAHATGAACANIEYRLMPQVRMAETVADVAAGLRLALSRHDPDKPLLICGHSAGGHLAITAAAAAARALPPRCTVAPISGIYDLMPIAGSFLQEELHLTPDEIVQWSPLSYARFAGAPHDLIVGGTETPEYHRQADAIRARLPQAQRFDVPGKHHVSVVQDLAEPMSPLFRRLAGYLI